MLRYCEVCDSEFDGRKSSGQGKFCSDRCRFWGKVELGASGQCWVWTASVTGKGYGKISIAWKMLQAHRVAFEWFHGPVPSGLYVCHRCDHRRCVNPEHLFVGTHRDNVDDMLRKGRASGQDHPYDPSIECKRGHPVGGTSYIDRNGRRICRPCRQAKRKAKRERRNVSRVEQSDVRISA